MEQMSQEKLAQEEDKAHSESKFKSFALDLESSLKKFESADEWPDWMKNLSKLQKVLNLY